MISGPVRAGFVIVIAVGGVAGCGKRSAHVSVPPAPAASIAPARIGSEETGIASWYGIPYHGRRTASGEIYDMEKLTAAHRSLPFQTWVEVTNLQNGKRVDVRITDRGPFVAGRIIDLSHRAARDIEMLGPGIVKVRLRVIEPPKDFPPANDAPPQDNPPPQDHAPAERPSDTLAEEREPCQGNVPAQPDTTSEPIDSSQSARPTGEPTGRMPESNRTPELVTSMPTPKMPSSELPTRNGMGYAIQAGAFAERERAEALQFRLSGLYMDARVVLGTSNLWRVIVGRQLSRKEAAVLANRVRKDAGTSLVVPEPE